MATPNYSYEKRQRELAKKRKNEEKRQRKLNKGDNAGEANTDGAADVEAGEAQGSETASGTPPTPA